MKKIVQINVVCNGSTGKIMCDIAKKANDEGFQTYCFYGRGNPNKAVNCIRIGNKITVYFHALLARVGFNGRGSYFATKSLIRKIKKINPDIIHMHNIHGYYVNINVLFDYLKDEFKGKIIWTLHDCWSFTGHCSYFTIAKCNNWEIECKNCPQLSAYPKTKFDFSKKEYDIKKRLFTDISNLTLVTPSVWLKELISKSFLKEYNVEVINNGIDLDIFKPTYEESIYDVYNIPKNKNIILGVANIWEERKGLSDFVKLSKLITDDYVIVLVGKLLQSESILPNNIIHINRTDNSNDLAKIYTIANVFVNPTYEDNYPTTNLEAQACGTYVLTYATGGCGEQVSKTNGMVIEVGNVNEIFKQIKNNSKVELIHKKGLLDLTFSCKSRYNQYLQLYNMQSKKVRIVYVCSSLDNGGVESLMYNISNNIDKSKYDISLITFDNKIGLLEKKFEDKIIHIPPIKKGIISYYKSLNKILNYDNFDIIHSNIGIYSFICLFIAKKNNIKIRICHSHNCIKNMNLRFKIKKLVFQKLNNYFATDYVACGIDAGIWQFGKAAYNNNKIFFLNNAIEINKFKFNIELRRKYRKEFDIDEKIVIGHVGRLSYEKNHDFIIEIANFLKNDNYCFLLIGSGIEYENIKKKIDDNNLGHCVKLLGPINNVNEIINCFDIMILPSLYEAFPITIIEAQINGLPCIISNNVTTQIKINDNIKYLPIGKDSIKQWCDYIINQTEEKSNRCAYNKKMDSFDISKITKQLEQFYSNLEMRNYGSRK